MYFFYSGGICEDINFFQKKTQIKKRNFNSSSNINEVKHRKLHSSLMISSFSKAFPFFNQNKNKVQKSVIQKQVLKIYNLKYRLGFIQNDKEWKNVKGKKRSSMLFFSGLQSSTLSSKATVENDTLPGLQPSITVQKVSFANIERICSRDSILTEKKLKLYLLSIGGVNSSEAVQSYLNKHQLIGQISCDQFIESILPYTPDVLRNVKSTILWQIQAAKTISDETELYYHDVVRRQIFHILRISAFKHRISPQTWTDVKKFILADIQASAPLKQKNYIQNQTCNFMIIRKWLEIWLHVSEYQILNIMRWFRGQDEKNIQKIFSCVNVKEIKCTCNNEQTKGIIDNTKRNGYFSQIKPKEEEFDDAEIMEIWCEYVFTIINSEKEMQEQRKHFANYVKEIKDILKNEVISKKKSFTSVTKLINVIEKYMRITPSQLIRWKQNLSNLLLDNSVINTLFFQKPFPENPDQANVLKPSEQKLAIAQLLKTFCETKSKLVTLSLKIKSNNVGKRMFQLLKSDKSYAHITRKEIVQILEEMEAVCEQSQIDVLMKHFGNGKIITQISFCNVFHIQSNQ